MMFAQTIVELPKYGASSRDAPISVASVPTPARKTTIPSRRDERTTKVLPCPRVERTRRRDDGVMSLLDELVPGLWRFTVRRNGIPPDDDGLRAARRRGHDPGRPARRRRDRPAADGARRDRARTRAHPRHHALPRSRLRASLATQARSARGHDLRARALRHAARRPLRLPAAARPR